MSNLGLTHAKVALLGDSITVRATLASGTPPANSVSAICPWNWVNWLLGAPFVFVQNLAVSGDPASGTRQQAVSVDRQDLGRRQWQASTSYGWKET